MINSNLFPILAQTYVKLLDNDVIVKGKKMDYNGNFDITRMLKINTRILDTHCIFHLNQ
jgi:hypothetical protein